jgi:hypothetical protein
VVPEEQVAFPGRGRRRGQTPLGLLHAELEVLARLVEGGVQSQGALVVGDGGAQASEAVVGVAEVVENPGGGAARLDELFVAFHGRFVVSLAVGRGGGLKLLLQVRSGERA